MSTLSSTSTTAEIKAAYDDNASYEEDGSATKARAFITACRLLLRRLPVQVGRSGRGSEEVRLDPDLLRRQLEDAQVWLASSPDASDLGGVRHPSFANFRA